MRKKHNKKFLVEVVGCAFDSYWYHSWKGKIVAPLNYFKMKVGVREANYAIYVTESFLQRRYKTKGRSFSCSDVIFYENDESILNNRIAKINSKLDNSIILGTIGAIDVTYKGQEIVIRSIANLSMDGINFEYWLIGSGNQEHLTKVATKYGVLKNIKFVGPVSHNNIFEILDQLDVYVHPSLTEGLPRSVIEAMSRACPVIGSDVGGMSEIISSDCLFEKNKYSQFEDIIRGRVNDKLWLKDKANLNFESSIKYDPKHNNEKRDLILKEFFV